MSQQPTRDARLVAVQVLLRVMRDGESLSTALPAEVNQVSERDRALLQALTYGVLRWRWRLEAWLGQLLKSPLKTKDQDVELILILGLFQLQWMRMPDYAVVNAAVKSTQKIRKKWASGLVNGVLRNFIRQRDVITDKPLDLQAQYAHPDWMIQRLQRDWPDDWQQILEHNNEPAPMTLRIDTRRISLADYQAQLAAMDVSSTPIHLCPSALMLDKAVDVTQLPGFDDGLVAVQDAAAQLAALLMDPQAGESILDACAAPGGKTGHLLQLQNELTVDAVDVSEHRLTRVSENLDRLQVQARLIAADVGDPDSWWSGELYDRILLDAPCSASGIIRRHPDIKSLRRADDIEALVMTQSRLLDAVWNLLKPGGVLLYSTCSVFNAENVDQMQAFVSRTSDATVMPLDVDWGHQMSIGRQLLPAEHNSDGFYYAKLQKEC